MPAFEQPATNEAGEVELPDGDTVHPDLFADLEDTLHESGDDKWRNRFDVDEDDPITPFTASPSFTATKVAGVRHAERSRQARTADESFNAPIAPDYATWRANPNRYDLPGVDTIPDERQRERAGTYLERAQAAGAVDTFKHTDSLAKASWKGSFGAARRELKLRPEEKLRDEKPGYRPGPVLAHEVGHAVDHKVFTDVLDRNPDQIDDETQRLYDEHADGFDTKYWSQLILEDDPELRQEVRKLSERKRGAIDGKKAIGDTWHAYRMRNQELLADAFAVTALEPRAARREAPRAAALIEEEFLPALERDRSGRPLEVDT